VPEAVAAFEPSGLSEAYSGRLRCGFCARQLASALAPSHAECVTVTSTASQSQALRDSHGPRVTVTRARQLRFLARTLAYGIAY
jgi:hypothetical protein